MLKYTREKESLKSKLRDVLADENLNEWEKQDKAHSTMKVLEALKKNVCMERRNRMKIKNQLDSETMCQY